MRLSRWHRSAYETDAELAEQSARLQDHVTALPQRQDAEIVVVTSGLRVDEAFLEKTPSARLVITTTSGSDHLDLPLLASRRIRAVRLPLARRDAVVEAALGLLLAGLRRIGTHRADAAAGRWSRAGLPTSGIGSLRGSAVGVVGLGVIGSQMAAVLRALGAEVWGVDPHVWLHGRDRLDGRGRLDGVHRVSLDDALAGCVAVTLHCDLNPSSAGMISAARLERSRPGLVLVNTARGGLVDVDAAVSALCAGRLGGLGLDVFPQEPYPQLARVSAHPDLWFAPHAAGYHPGLGRMIGDGIVSAVSAFVEGRPLPHQLC